MATDQLMAPIPSLVLAPGMRIRLEAISSTTGLAVAGVTVSAIAISGPSIAAEPTSRQRLPLAFLSVPEDDAAVAEMGRELAAEGDSG